MRHATIFDGKNSQRIPAENFHLLLADPNRQISRRIMMGLILVIMGVMMGLKIWFMSSENESEMKKNVEDRKQRK